MNDSFRRTLALAAVCLLAWGAWYGWESWKMRQAVHALEDVVRSADLNKLLSNPPAEVQNSVDLAIRGIHLSQGRDGRKSFDIKADWATLNQDSGSVTVRYPDIHYNLKDDADGSPRTVHATSNIGRVEDGNQKISMSKNVRAQYEEKVLTGDLAIFFNQLNKLTFPGGADLDSPDLSGTCARLTWDLNTNILMGDHGVKFRWYPSAQSEKTSQDQAPVSDSTENTKEDSIS
ncbi:MAG: LPS export ABC transporter periplasmic protein LptC [Mailhella sp.]|nr:LPS export ABC transporter periplasmic protein LptC [Mailhella sp.]